MPHEPRLTIALRDLLHRHRVAALGTLGSDGAPHVSMVPFALCAAEASLVLHVSGLAAHTRHMLLCPTVSLMVAQAEVATEPVHALPRATMAGTAQFLALHTPSWQACRAAYLARFPDAEPMTQLADFRFVAIRVHATRHVAGFGAARNVEAAELEAALHQPA